MSLPFTNSNTFSAADADNLVAELTALALELQAKEKWKEGETREFTSLITQQIDQATKEDYLESFFEETLDSLFTNIRQNLYMRESPAVPTSKLLPDPQFTRAIVREIDNYDADKLLEVLRKEFVDMGTHGNWTKRLNLDNDQNLMYAVQVFSISTLVFVNAAYHSETIS